MAHSHNQITINFCKSLEVGDRACQGALLALQEDNIPFKAHIAPRLGLTEHHYGILRNTYAVADFKLDRSQALKYRMVKAPVNTDSLGRNHRSEQVQQMKFVLQDYFLLGILKV